MEEFNEIMESDDNFFLIQQIQDKVQTLEDKKSSQKDQKEFYISEITHLEKVESDLDAKLEKIQEQYTHLDAHLFDEIDENLVSSSLNHRNCCSRRM